MKLKITLFIIFSVFTQLLTSQNAVSNGNFEANKEDWNGFNNQVLKDDKINSFVGNVNNGEGSLLQILTLAPNTTYKVAFDYRWVSGNGNYNMTVRLKTGTTGGEDLNTLVLDSNPDVWKTRSFSITTPANITEVRIVFYKVNGNRPLRIDNVVVIDENYTPNFVDSETPINVQPNGAAGSWVLDFSDEFNASSLDVTKWYKSVSTRTRTPRENIGVTDWRWIAENAFLNNQGQLVLRATKINNTTMRCGSIESRGLYEVKYGYLEAKIKIAKTAKGNHTAFWLQGENQGNVDNSAADGAEVDIFESAWVTNTSKAVVHYDGYGANKKNHTIPFNTPNIHNDEFHTYGLL